jgi:homoserine dehydrogenase
MGTGFLQNDAAWRELPRLEPGESRSPFYFRLLVDDRPGTLARVAEVLSRHEVSIARLVQHQAGSGATLHVVTHEAPAGALGSALGELESLDEVRRRSRPIPVVSDRGVAELGWA